MEPTHAGWPAVTVYRAPTIAEAVAFLLMPCSLDYRRRCFAYWRERVGETFVIQVRKELAAKWRARKRKGAL